LSKDSPYPVRCTRAFSAGVRLNSVVGSHSNNERMVSTIYRTLGRRCQFPLEHLTGSLCSTFVGARYCHLNFVTDTKQFCCILRWWTYRGCCSKGDGART